MMIETDCYASGWHLHDDAEREHFRRQVMAYLARLRQRFSQLADDAGGDGIRIESLGSAYLQTHAEFRVRFWLVETVIDLARRKSFPPAGAVERIMQATDLARCLLSPKSAAIRDQLCAARKSLAQALPGHVHEIVIAYDPAEPTLSSDDEFAWWRMFSQPGAGPILAARWETIDDQVSRSANFRAELEDEETKRITLTRGQEECAAELEGYWHALINGGQASGYRLRPPLLVAPSGSGKSRLVGWLADKLRVPLYVVDTSSWMISGSRADMGTLKLLEAWHAANDRGLVLIDEIDKADGREVGWWKNVNMEMMCYIDGRIQWPRRLLRKLRSQFLIIGAGTWQHEHRQEQRPLGFANGRSGNVLVAIESTFGTDQSIPEELAFRFDTPLILAPPTHEEFAERIAAIRSELMLPALSTECLAALCADAVASRRGQRFIEGYAGRMLRDRARCAQVAECFDF